MNYLCSFWYSVGSQTVAPIYRSDNIRKFKKEVKRIFKENRITHYRVVRIQNYIIVSAPTDPRSIYSWYHTEFTRMPEYLEYFNFKQDHKIHLEEVEHDSNY